MINEFKAWEQVNIQRIFGAQHLLKNFKDFPHVIEKRRGTSLRPPGRKDLEIISGWMNKYQKRLVYPADYFTSECWPCEFLFLLERSSKCIGMAGFSQGQTPKTARMLIFIAEKQDWGRGYGSDALDGLLGILFDRNTTEKVICEVVDCNLRAKRMLSKWGFETIQCLPGEVESGSEVFGVYVMEVARKRWEKIFWEKYDCC